MVYYEYMIDRLSGHVARVMTARLRGSIRVLLCESHLLQQHFEVFVMGAPEGHLHDPR